MAERPDASVTPAEEAVRRAARRKRRIAEIFGDSLPETTADERPDAEGTNETEDRLRREVPPHHG